MTEALVLFFCPAIIPSSIEQGAFPQLVGEHNRESSDGTKIAHSGTVLAAVTGQGR
jgi:hypothetical protein